MWEGRRVNGKSTLAIAACVIATLTTAYVAKSDANVPSDQNLRYSRAYVERAYDMLSHDAEDYGGHRVAAMNDIAQARTDLSLALHFDTNRGDAAIPSAARPQDADLSSWERGQVASNQNLEYTRRYVERAIDMLQHDAHDYNGYRAKAVASLEAAREQIKDAMQYRDAHRMGHGSMGSDDNLRYARLYIGRAADMLQHDAHDYAGHRAAAVADITTAQSDLTAALASDSNKEDAMLPAHAMAGDADLDSYYLRGQFASNENIEYARRYVERAMDMLQHDAHDYNGYRVKAVSALQAARGQLLAALKSQ
jgi:hypothetical protein